MISVTLLTAPARADLTARHVDAVRRLCEGGPAEWLNPAIAAEFLAPGLPDDFEEHQERMNEEGYDLLVQPAFDRRKPLLLADMDSTMIAQECIDELADYMGIGAEVAAITAAAMNGELDFEAALTARVALLEGLPASAVEEVLDTRITLSPGGAELVATMRANGAFTALVSGGFTAFSGAVADQLGFDTHRANILLTDGDRLTGEVAHPILGREAKVETMSELCDHLGLTHDDVLAVGDGANDLGMLGRAGVGVALHAKPIVADQVDFRIDHGDLTGLLYLQGYHRDEFVSA